MSSLIPEVRMNKNGHLVTKHVRAMEAPAAGGRGIPAPLKPSEMSPREEMLRRVEDAVRGAYEHHGLHLQDVPRCDHLMGTFEGYNTATIKAYHDAIAGDEGNSYAMLLISVLHNEETYDQAGLLLFAAGKAGNAVLDDGWWASKNGSYSYGLLVTAVNGIRNIDDDFGFTVPDSIFDHDNPKDVETIGALIEATMAVKSLDGEFGLTYFYDPYTGDEKGCYLDNDDLIQTVIDHPDEVEKIIGLIYDRETTDGALIREVLESESPAISEGTL